jgi:hypothetical protein
MRAIAKQLLQAAPGMYRLEHKAQTAELVVMWVLANAWEGDQVQQQVIGITVMDLRGDLETAITDYFNVNDIEYSCIVPPAYKKIK